MRSILKGSSPTTRGVICCTISLTTRMPSGPWRNKHGPWAVPKTDETSVSSELDDHLAHLADGACRGAHGLWEGDGQEVRVESGDFHTRLSYGQRPLSCSTLLARCTLDAILHFRAMARASKVWGA